MHVWLLSVCLVLCCIAPTAQALTLTIQQEIPLNGAPTNAEGIAVIPTGPNAGIYVPHRDSSLVTVLNATTGEFMYNFNPGFVGGNLRSIDVLDNGNLLLYDNGTRHDPPETRVVEYRLDPVANTADMVWQFRRQPPLYVPYTGSAQRLEGGNTVIGYSNRGLVTEVDPKGAVVWEGTVMIAPDRSGDFYRAIKIASLYRYERP